MAFKRLNAEHYEAIKWLSQPKRGGKTYEEIAELCGVSRATIFNWKNDPLFERELKRQIVRNTLDKLPEVFESVPDIIVRDGNAAMLKTLLQAHDMLEDRVTVTSKDDGDNVDVDDIRQRLKERKQRESNE